MNIQNQNFIQKRLENFLLFKKSHEKEVKTKDIPTTIATPQPVKKVKKKKTKTFSDIFNCGSDNSNFFG